MSVRRTAAGEAHAVRRLSLSDARRVAIAAQGLDAPRPTGTITTRDVRRVIHRLGLLQIDSVSIIAPAHYQVLYSRLGPYDRALLDTLVYRRREFTEHWAHEASILPSAHWALLRHRMEPNERKTRVLGAFLAEHPTYAAEVLELVRTRGAVAAGDVPEPDGRIGTGDGWWGWTMAKCVLEGMLAHGTLAVADRRSAGFARLYDLTERVIPSVHRSQAHTREEAQRELVRLSVRALGVGTARDIADYYRLPPRDARSSIASLERDGALQRVAVAGWREPAWMIPGTRVPRQVHGASLLSPFDPLIWFRPRAERLFDFEHRLEIYTPAPRRRWGYYVLPFLLGERIVARVDLKADRRAGVLQVLASHVEAHADPQAVCEALRDELRTLARWLALGEVRVARKGALARALASAMRGGRAPAR